MKETLEARILDLTTLLQESQAVASKEHRLRENVERKLQTLPNNWKELIKEIHDLRESEWRQKQDYEAMKGRNQRLEDEVCHL
jgi:cell division protein FtsB